MIRPALQADEPAIIAIAEDAYARYVPLIGKRPAPMDADFSRHIAREETFVVDYEGVVGGFIIQFETPDGWFIENVAVGSASQGSGLGFAMLCDADRRARDNGCKRVYLYTNEVMTETCDWYLKNGYTETHRTTEHGFNRIYLEKVLTP